MESASRSVLRRPFLAAIALAVLLAAAGCGGGSKTPTQVVTVTDALVIASIAPPDTTPIAAGSTVTFVATVSYRLNTVPSAPIHLLVQDQSGHDLTTMPVSATATSGEAQVTLTQIVAVPKTGVSQIQVIADLAPGGNFEDTAAAVTYTVN